MSDEQRPALMIRPRRMRRIAVPMAVVLLAFFAIGAVLLRHSSTGVHFGLSDQVALGLIGLLLAVGVLLVARPVVRADEQGVQVRNLLFGHQLPWSLIRGVSFPDGAPWARLELPADEYVPVVAIQAIDGAQAVLAIRALRARYREANTLADKESPS